MKKVTLFALCFLTQILFLVSSFCQDQNNSTTYIYDEMYKNYSLIHNQDTAILIVAYNRPEYLKECITSIEKNPEASELAFIFALDGGTYAKQAENIKIIQESSLKNSIVLLRSKHYGCAKNHIDSKRFVFEWCKFKKVIILEDDIIVTANYFSFMLNLHAWATRTYENIGAVQGWTHCYLPVDQKKEHLNQVQENPQYWSFVTYCLDNTCWKKISPILYDFESFIDQIPPTDQYTRERSRPTKWSGILAIRKWVHSLVNQKLSEPINHGPSHLPSKLSVTTEFLSSDFLSSQDVIMGLAFYLNDLIKLQTVVNRARHIGKYGLTITEDYFDQHHSTIKLDSFQEDSTLTPFVLK